MITYQLDYWQIKFLFQLRGSVLPKAFVWAVPSTVLAVVLSYYGPKDPSMNVSVFSTWNFVLGYLVVFRANQAYSRFWEAGTIMQRFRGNWFNAVSSCFSFCSPAPEKASEVLKFKHMLIRLLSLLYCSALQQIGVCKDEQFEVIDIDGFDRESMEYLAVAPEKSLVVLQWIQQLVMKNQANGVIIAPAPILSRVFQELSNGIVATVDAQKISDLVFPFPLAQMVGGMLVFSAILSPILLATVLESPLWIAFLNFAVVLSFFGINFIAAEIEMPFGDDENDLPLHTLQCALNTSLIELLDPHMSQCPDLNLTADAMLCKRYRCPEFLVGTKQKIFIADYNEGNVSRQMSRRSHLAMSEFATFRTHEKEDKDASEGSSKVCFKEAQERSSFHVITEAVAEALAPSEKNNGSLHNMITGTGPEALASSKTTNSSLHGNSRRISPKLCTRDAPCHFYKTSKARGTQHSVLPVPALEQLLQQSSEHIENQLAEHSVHVKNHIIRVRSIFSDHLSWIAEEMEMRSEVDLSMVSVSDKACQGQKAAFPSQQEEWRTIEAT
eukprot:TRINITY_DN14724_c0_g1_i1.p1 TRINITY_DN14724_c0_g1~~TRINITY_DN14724_c0_g1_i1.p1  ORF type:complete len:554 (-),score=96.79 TRINITY_DN14724_c0_g1_i1:87-1748(-)